MQTQKSLERIFHYQERPVRTVLRDSEPWFVAVDVCGALEIANTGDAISRIDFDDIGLIDSVDSRGRRQKMNIISEAGLYTLALGSRKPEAKSFRHWITHEVIPALRKTGSYQMSEPSTGRGALLQFSRRDLLNLAVEAENECEELRTENAELRPKAEFYDRVADTSNSFSLGETAKMLETFGYGRNNLIRFLREEGVLMANNVAKQRYIDRGYFHIVQVDYDAPDGTPRVKAVTRVYEKGVEYIKHLLDDGDGDGEYLDAGKQRADSGHSRSASEGRTHAGKQRADSGHSRSASATKWRTKEPTGGDRSRNNGQLIQRRDSL